MSSSISCPRREGFHGVKRYTGDISVGDSCAPDVEPLLSAAETSGWRPTHLARRLHLQPWAVRSSPVHATAQQRLLDPGALQGAAAWPLSYLLPAETVDRWPERNPPSEVATHQGLGGSEGGKQRKTAGAEQGFATQPERTQGPAYFRPQCAQPSRSIIRKCSPDLHTGDVMVGGVFSVRVLVDVHTA